MLLLAINLCILPYYIPNMSSVMCLYYLQLLTLIPCIVFKHINIMRRLTVSVTMYGLAPVISFGFIPFAVVVLTKHFANYALSFTVVETL